MNVAKYIMIHGNSYEKFVKNFFQIFVTDFAIKMVI
jgi:hypothetical protein